MLNRKAIFMTALILVTLPMTAAQSGQLDKGPGMIGAGSPLYGLEVAMDNAAVGIGLAKPGGIAKERAAEAQKAVENGNGKAAVKAGKQLEKVAEKADDEESEDIQTAMNSFQESMSKMQQRIQDAPNEQARQGMETALENMHGAYQNMQEAQKRVNRSGSEADNPPMPPVESENRSNQREQGGGNNGSGQANTGNSQARRP